MLCCSRRRAGYLQRQGQERGKLTCRARQARGLTPTIAREEGIIPGGHGRLELRGLALGQGGLPWLGGELQKGEHGAGGRHAPMVAAPLMIPAPSDGTPVLQS